MSLQQVIMENRHLIEEPSVIGQLEKNAIVKEDATTRGLLVSPVIYQQGIASFGIYILYNLINMTEGKWEDIFERTDKTLEKLKSDPKVNYEETAAWYEKFKEYKLSLAKKGEKWALERGYMVPPILERILTKEGYPATFSWETFTPANEFDWVGFSMYYEPQILNMIHMLKKSNIPLYSKDRLNTKDPLIIVGGVVAYSAEPIADMVDLVFIGDGEVQLPKLYELIDEYKQGLIANKKELLKRIAIEIPGSYVPMFYKHTYDGAKITSIECIEEGVPAIIHKAVVPFEKHSPLNPPIIPNCEGVLLGANSYETSRGCPYSCRFCSGSFTNKPYREFTYGQLALFIPEIPKLWGLTSVKPYSFNLTSHNEMRKILKNMTEEFDKSVGSASQRVDTFSFNMAKALKSTGNSGCTIAFEAGSQRLRDVINKEITEEQIMYTAKSVIDLRYTQLKMYTMANLPTETYEDREALYELLKKIREYADSKGSNIVLRITSTLFNSKPFTPFQWADVSNLENTLENEGWISKFNDISVKVNSNLISNSRLLTQLLNRWDRRYGKFMEQLADSNVTYIKTDICKDRDFIGEIEKYVQEVTGTQGLTVKDLLGELPEDWIFPYDMLDAGITKEWLLGEWKKAKALENTTSCHTGCSNCGACTRKEYISQGVKIPKKLDIDIPEQEVIDSIANSTSDPVLTKLVMKVKLKPVARFMPTSKMKVLLRSAFQLAEVPVKDRMEMVSEVGGLGNYSFGEDIITLKAEEFIQNFSKDTLAVIQETLKDYYTIENISPFNTHDTPGLQSIDGILYSMYIDLEKFGLTELPEIFNVENYDCEVKEKKKTRRIGAYETEIRQITIPKIKSVNVKINGEPSTLHKIYFKLSKSINPNDVLALVFNDNRSKRILKASPIFRETFYKTQDAPSVLYKKCSCGAVREHDAFGKPLPVCLECMMQDDSIIIK